MISVNVKMFHKLLFGTFGIYFDDQCLRYASINPNDINHCALPFLFVNQLSVLHLALVCNGNV